MESINPPTSAHTPNCTLCVKNSKSCKCGKDGCELTTITASQISSAIVFLVYVGITLVKVMFLNEKDLAKEQLEYITRVTIIPIYLLALVYYFLGCWATEEELVDDLRDLNQLFLFYSQWFLRILILLLFGFYSNITIRSGWFKDLIANEDIVYINVFYIAIVFGLFTLWDVIVVIGGKGHIIRRYIWVDVIGTISFILLLFLFNKRYENYKIFYPISLAIFIGLGFLICRAIITLHPLKAIKRIAHKNQIR